MERTDTPYTAKDIALSLDIGDSTLRKWCLALEEHEYKFYRTDQNKRLFTEQDIIVLRHFQQLVKDKNMSMNNAALIVTSRFKKAPFSDETALEQLEEEANTVPAMRSDAPFIQELIDKMQTMEEQQNQLIEMNRALLTRLDEQRKHFEERLSKRDDFLMQSLKESQETKKLLLETKEKQQTEEIEKQEQLLNMNSALLSRLDEQQNYIEERLNKRDEMLMQSLRESRESKKLLLEVKEQQTLEQEQKKNRKGLMRFFSRD